jgi:hypothetical protein
MSTQGLPVHLKVFQQAGVINNDKVPDFIMVYIFQLVLFQEGANSFFNKLKKTKIMS